LIVARVIWDIKYHIFEFRPIDHLGLHSVRYLDSLLKVVPPKPVLFKYIKKFLTDKIDMMIDHTIIHHREIYLMA